MYTALLEYASFPIGFLLYLFIFYFLFSPFIDFNMLFFCEQWCTFFDGDQIFSNVFKQKLGGQDVKVLSLFILYCWYLCVLELIIM